VAGFSTDAVLEDNDRGANMLTTHLIQHGHRSFAYVTGPMSNSSSQERFQGFMGALKENGLPIQPNQVRISDWTYSGGYATTLELTRKSRHQPTAIFYANANMAVGALRALRKHNLKVPQDIAIVSFENISITDAVEPPLTTLKRVNHKLGELSFKLLQARMSDKSTRVTRPIERVINAKLCVRESCGCHGST
jgi:DNA-binding LacI/PurR family transcriptional regulator